MADDDAAQDAPPALAGLIQRHGVIMGYRIAAFATELSERMDGTLRAAFAHGVTEGMEISAQAVETYAAHIEQAVPEAPAVAWYLRGLRDQIRVAALSVEIPS